MGVFSDKPLFDEFNPIIEQVTGVEEGESYQEYVDRIIELYPNPWQKEFIRYFSLISPIVQLSYIGVVEPDSVKSLEIFDLDVLQLQNGIYESMVSRGADVQLSLNSQSFQLTSSYRNKITRQGLLCLYSYEKLRKEMKNKEREKLENSGKWKLARIINKLLGAKDGEGIVTVVPMDPTQPNIPDLIINSQIKIFNFVHNFFTYPDEKPIRELFEYSNLAFEDILYSVGVSKDSIANIKLLAGESYH